MTATIIISVLLAAAVVAAAVKIIISRKNGKGCSCGCSGCTMSKGSCPYSDKTEGTARK